MKKFYLIVLLILFFLPGHLLAACVVSDIAVNDFESGSWDSDCTSSKNAGVYAQYYTFLLTSTQEITIDLSSSVDTLLYLLDGAGQNGPVLKANNDISSSNKNSRIVTILRAGRYTIEATMSGQNRTGHFTVSVGVTTAVNDVCDYDLEVNIDVTNSWDAGCTSIHRASRYAKYYTFTLLADQEVTIDLQSARDAYMFLLAGAGETGPVVAEDDDDGVGTNSRITRTLTAGSYTIEATTSAGTQSGDFTVSVTVDETPPPPECEYQIDTGVDVKGSWDPACASTHRVGAYASYYTFSLASTQEVTIDLTSSKDTYLFLLQGSGQTGEELDRNDDSGDGDNSRITMTLSAGTYTVEATTYSSATTGSFVISVSAKEPGCDDCPFPINSGLNDAWFNPATGGQGFTILVYPVMKQMFVTWFTFDVERPPGDLTAMLGDPGQRWLTAQGPYDGDTATLTIYVTEGGVFDAATPAATTDQDGDGTMTIQFADCDNGLVMYDITSLGFSDEIPIERIVQDNVPLCEMLAKP